MTAARNMVPVALEMILQEVQTVSGRNMCDFSEMTCGPVDNRSTILKQLDGSVTSYYYHTHSNFSGRYSLAPFRISYAKSVD